MVVGRRVGIRVRKNAIVQVARMVVARRTMVIVGPWLGPGCVEKAGSLMTTTGWTDATLSISSFARIVVYNTTALRRRTGPPDKPLSPRVIVSATAVAP